MNEILENKHNCVYTAKSGGYIQLFIHKRCVQLTRIKDVIIN